MLKSSFHEKCTLKCLNNCTLRSYENCANDSPQEHLWPFTKRGKIVMKIMSKNNAKKVSVVLKGRLMMFVPAVCVSGGIWRGSSICSSLFMRWRSAGKNILVFYDRSAIRMFHLFYHRVAVQIIRFLHVVHTVVLCASSMYEKPELLHLTVIPSHILIRLIKVYTKLH